MSGEVSLGEPIDADVDLKVEAQRRELVRHHGPVLTAIALGGGLGALARYGMALMVPTAPGGFPWATFFTNILGCLLIGVLMVLISEVWSAHRLVRPFLGVGVLGGFTTFSTYAVEIRGLLQPGTAGLAFAYLAGTLAGAMLAVFAGVAATKTLCRLGTTRQEAPALAGKPKA
ncbi:fluoride efflux transporter FluC [Amycolatopsis pigmentata]|uniref:Fluoride-specific ion channel FluC n=1 Tax=Amycolatopsis pigmentata TaxID=450801 RepID=A0ABW5G2G6_9PSEU